MTDAQREIRSGWMRTFVTTAAGVLALVVSTYTVIAKVTQVQLTVESNVVAIEKHDRRIEALEAKQLPDGLERGQLQSALQSVRMSLESIERRLQRMEERSNR